MIRSYWKIFTLLLILLAQTACTFSVDVDPTPTIQVATQPAATATPSKSTDADGCPITEAGDAIPYRNDENKYCLLYPENFTVIPPRFIVFNPTNAPGDTLGDAVVDIRMEPANGRTADQVAADAIAAAGQGFDIQMEQVVVDDARAFVVIGLPGQDPMRKVYVVSHDRLYTLTFMPWGNNPELETAYDWIIKTLHFLP